MNRFKRVKVSREEIRQIFSDEGKEPLTDDLIAELVKRGWSKRDLLLAREAGAKYCRSRDSVFFPTQFVS